MVSKKKLTDWLTWFEQQDIARANTIFKQVIRGIVYLV